MARRFSSAIDFHVLTGIFVSIVALFNACASPISAQDLVIQKRIEVAGTIDAIQPGQLWIRSSEGSVTQCKIQMPDEDRVALSGAEAVVRFPATILVRGDAKLDSLSAGTWIGFEAQLGFRGVSDGSISRVTLMPENGRDPGITVAAEPTREEPHVPARVVGTLVRILNERLIVEVGRSKLARNGRLIVPLADDARVVFADRDLARVKRGDRVRRAVVAEFSTGDLVIESIEVEVDREEAVNQAGETDEMYLSLSDEPMAPRDVRSNHFLLHTDISERSAAILLDKLERMIELVSGYYQRPPRGPIECFVVRDLRQWPEGSLEEGGAIKIARGEGITYSQSLGRLTRSIVYSCADHGVVQHESIHAYCAQTFGDTGPTWYAEGMAEMGQYWREGELAVNIDPLVAEYLSKGEPKDLLAIVATDQITGDSWQAYAWRWALCHMLGNNPNYSGRFRALGIGMMTGESVGFESVYGDVADHIVFEYGQFVDHVGNGYRADLTAWQWNQRFVPLRPRRRVSHDVQAAYGWQASGMELDKSHSYEVSTVGDWKLSESGDALDADGSRDGRGRLMGVIMSGFELSEPFVVGADGAFRPPQSGRLFVRCQDDWTELGDNSGEIRLTLLRQD